MPETKILIVEDDNAMAQMCAKLLRRRGHSVLIANSGLDAVAIVRFGGDVDLVISDFRMPQMDGLQLVGRLHEIDSTLPVILMTGFASDVRVEHATKFGISDCVIKPFDPDGLLTSIDKVLRTRQVPASGV